MYVPLSMLTQLKVSSTFVFTSARRVVRVELNSSAVCSWLAAASMSWYASRSHTLSVRLLNVDSLNVTLRLQGEYLACMRGDNSAV